MANGLGGFLQNMFNPQRAPVQRPGTAFQDPMQGMGFLQRLSYMRDNNPEALMGLSAGLIQGDIGKGFALAGDQMAAHRKELMERQQQHQQQNMTKRWLMANKGLSAEEAEMAMSNPAILNTYLKGGDTNEYQERAAAARDYGLTGDEATSFVLTGQLPSGRFGSGEVGLSPILTEGPEGETVLFQPSKTGKAVRTQFPEGYKPLAPYDRAYQTSSGQTAGKGRGEAQFDLPRVEQNAAQTLEVIDQLKSHPGRAAATGLSSWLDPRNYIAGTDAANFHAMRQQLAGKTFLEAYQTLKGGGQITEIEGQKAENAIARLQTAQSDAAFMQALDDFEDVVRRGLERAREQAGVPRAASPMRQKYGLE